MNGTEEWGRARPPYADKVLRDFGTTDYGTPADGETPGRPAWLVTDFDSYWQAQGYTRTGTEYDRDDLADAFEAGMQAQRDLAAQQSAPSRATTWLDGDGKNADERDDRA
jgi:hypothetical protein